MPVLKQNLNQTYGKSLMPILPLTMEDFESILEMRSYLLSEPMVTVFLNKEVRALENLAFLADDVAQNVIKNGFEKLEKIPYPKWVKMNGGK